MSNRTKTWLAWTLIVLICGCSTTKRTASTKLSPALPEILQVTGPVIARVHAHGFQVYTCRRDAKGNLAWIFLAPDAAFDGPNGIQGRHYAGPTWESATDGSKVVGVKIAQYPSPKPDAVPWLLLSAASHDGDGIFSNVTFIQRINTAGGAAPPVSNAAAGDELQVPYIADYIFYGPAATTQPTRP